MYSILKIFVKACLFEHIRQEQHLIQPLCFKISNVYIIKY